jgi:hypothetical protein
MLLLASCLLAAGAQAAANWKLGSDGGEACVTDALQPVPWMPKKGKNLPLMEAFSATPEAFHLYWRVPHVFGGGSYYPLDDIIMLRFARLDPVNRGARVYEALTRSGQRLAASDNASPLRACDFSGGQGENRCLPVLHLKFDCRNPDNGALQPRTLDFDANGLDSSPGQFMNESVLLQLARSSKPLTLGVAAQISDEDYGRIVARFASARAPGAEQMVKEKLRQAAQREALLEQQKNDARARAEKADALLRTARKDSVMQCDSGQTILPAGESIVSLSYRCDLTAGETYNLRTILRAGWVIDAEIRTLVQNAAGTAFYHVALRMRKAN